MARIKYTLPEAGSEHVFGGEDEDLAMGKGQVPRGKGQVGRQKEEGTDAKGKWEGRRTKGQVCFRFRLGP